MPLSLKHEFLRKLIHLSSFWIVGLVWVCPKTWSILLLSAITVFVLVTEYAAHKNSVCMRVYHFLFSSVLREKESYATLGFSGAAYVLLAALILVIIMPKMVAMFALSVLIFSDTMAALIGRAYGRHKLVGKKTWEGTMAFLISGWCICALFVHYGHLPLDPAFFGVFLGCLGDLFNDKVHIDDNLSIPLLAALPFLF